MHAAQDIDQGATPLWHCYGGSPLAMSAPQRQTRLRRAYGFDCACLRCTGPEAAREAARLTGVKCPFTKACPGLAIPAEGCEAGLTSRWEVPPGNGTCTVCQRGGRGALQRVLERLRSAADRVADAEELVAAVLQGSQHLQHIHKLLGMALDNVQAAALVRSAGGEGGRYADECMRDTAAGLVARTVHLTAVATAV